MNTTPVLGIPLISSQQAQPEVTHNTAILAMQSFLAGAIDMQNAPPGSPADGVVYIIGAAPTGAWTGRANKLAIFYGGWIYVPGVDDDGAEIAMGADQAGMMIWNKGTGMRLTWVGDAWETDEQVLSSGFGGPFVTQAELGASMALKVSKTGDTMTGALIVSSNSGCVIGTTGNAPVFTVQGDTAGTTQMVSALYRNSAGTAAAQVCRRGRGTIAAPLALLQNDLIGAWNFSGYQGTGNNNAATVTGAVIDPAISSTSFQGRLLVSVTPALSTTPTEVMRFEAGTGISMFGANVVIDQNRLIRPRVYTVATLPVAPGDAARAAVSDATAAVFGAAPVGGGTTHVPVYYDGGSSSWKTG